MVLSDVLMLLKAEALGVGSSLPPPPPPSGGVSHTGDLLSGQELQE